MLASTRIERRLHGGRCVHAGLQSVSKCLRIGAIALGCVEFGRADVDEAGDVFVFGQPEHLRDHRIVGRPTWSATVRRSRTPARPATARSTRTMRR
jgi:hypothetical protein